MRGGRRMARPLVDRAVRFGGVVVPGMGGTSRIVSVVVGGGSKGSRVLSEVGVGVGRWEVSPGVGHSGCVGF